MINSEKMIEMVENGGYWCQGDAVFLPAKSQEQAIAVYRQKISNAGIGINANIESVDAYKAKVASEDKRLAYREKVVILVAFCKMAIAYGIEVGLSQIPVDGGMRKANVIVFDLPQPQEKGRVDLDAKQVRFQILELEIELFSFLPSYTKRLETKLTHEENWNRLLNFNPVKL